MTVDDIVQAASDSAAPWASSSGAAREALLLTLADALQASREALVAMAREETHLPEARLSGELDRTLYQLRAFAADAKAGLYFHAVADDAVSGPPPAGRPQLTRVRVPLGPVAMFSASNFPFAFSVLGGDTASALAAGCPVVVKGHPAHPRLTQVVHALAQNALQRLQLPAGLIGLLASDAVEAGLQLVTHPRIQAVAFTGSLTGGQALARAVQSRAQPIPFYGELGSVNPMVVLPAAIDPAGAALIAASITQGSGQFCTSPGVVILMDSVPARGFATAIAQAVDTADLHGMLTPAIRHGFDAGVSAWSHHPGVQALTARRGASALAGFVGLTSGQTFLADAALRHEVFGAACLCVLVDGVDEACQVLLAIGGSLTVSLWGADQPEPGNLRLLRAAQSIAGRVLFKGVPTGVAVTRAQQHGGPWPASTQPLFTSVGSAAADRFLRPLALQDAPEWVVSRGGVPA